MAQGSLYAVFTRPSETLSACEPPSQCVPEAAAYLIDPVTDAYHYPSDLMSLLIETIPRLFRSKEDILTFFRACGTPDSLLVDLATQLHDDPTSVRKVHQTRTLLTRLNAGGDAMLGQRRQVIKRVVEFEDFTGCWPEDRLPAQGLVAQVRTRVAKADAFTRMADERDAESAVRRRTQSLEREAAAARRSTLGALSQELGGLFPWATRKREAADWRASSTDTSPPKEWAFARHSWCETKPLRPRWSKSTVSSNSTAISTLLRSSGGATALGQAKWRSTWFASTTAPE